MEYLTHILVDGNDYDVYRKFGSWLLNFRCDTINKSTRNIYLLNEIILIQNVVIILTRTTVAISNNWMIFFVFVVVKVYQDKFSCKFVKESEYL